MRCSTAFSVLCLGVFLQVPWVASVSMPTSNCYAFDNSSRIVDFSGWTGYLFEYDQKQGSDLSVRFCKDVESRSQTGYVDFGRFDRFNYFVAGSGQSDFVQEFYNGDLMGCEQSYDKMGRTAQVNIICGKCLNGQCKGRPGCICNVTNESNCRVLVDLAIPCDKPGPPVFQGFTVGFHPRSWELVYNGMTQIGFEKPHHDFSFHTGQTQVVLFMTAVASLSSLVHKPSLKVLPDKGLEVGLSGSAAKGKPPTTLSPSMLIVDWRCMVPLILGSSVFCAEFSLLKFNALTLFQVRWPVIPHMKLISQSLLRVMSQLNLCLQKHVTINRIQGEVAQEDGQYLECYLAYFLSLQHSFVVEGSFTRQKWNASVELMHCLA
ncbi:hypothetical protein D0Y65_003036 [Glycine soja]|uniref:Uncharacterized protein n=1 Tax=Glycine soja TaxID=3848 RepID=A0A445LJX0_GLYSO|nr:hypothetical protein D0Y65_003036 [Glycine soja]